MIREIGTDRHVAQFNERYMMMIMTMMMIMIMMIMTMKTAITDIH